MLDRDILILLRFEFLEILLLEDDVLAVLVLKTLYDILLLDLSAGALLARLFIPHARLRFLIYHIEPDIVLFDAALKRYGDIHQPEADTSFI